MSTLLELVQQGMEREGLLLYLVGGLTFVSVMAIWRSLIEVEPSAARARMLADRRRELVRAASARRPSRRPQADLQSLASLGRQLKLLQARQAEHVRDKLHRAGFRSRDALPVLLAVKVATAVAGAFAALALVNLTGIIQLPAPVAPGAPVLGMVLGFMSPDLYLVNRAKKRRLGVQRSLPDGLDLLVICAEAGLSLDAALGRVADEIAPSAPELADELGLTAIELGFLPERRQALLNLGRRCALPAMRGMVNTLIQTERYGTPLSQSLRVLSADFREQRMMRAEEKAARLPATMTVPMIVFILPTLFIVLGGPAVIDVYDSLIK